MFIVITGGSKSGKSLMAENIMASYRGRKFYIATMEPYTTEAAEAICRHRKMREGKGFETIEKYTDAGECNIENNALVLLECVGNLCANEMFSGEYAGDVAGKVGKDILTLAGKSEVMVAVTNNVGEDGIDYSRETMAYIRNIGKINTYISQYADAVIESVYGIPFMLKGKWEDKWSGERI